MASFSFAQTRIYITLSTRPICLEVLSPIPTVFFLHLTVALQRRTVYDFLISGHLLPDRELREREHLMLLGNILQAVIHFHEMIAFLTI